MTPSKGQTLAQIVAQKVDADPKLTWQDVALYNWGTDEPMEVNRALVELVGCSEVKDDCAQSVLDPDLGTSKKILIPKPFTAKDLPLEKTHTITVKKRLPAPAISLSRLSKWFVPEAETCDIAYHVEGSPERADTVDLEVRASNYCKVTPTPDGDFVTYAFAESKVPIYQKRKLFDQSPSRLATYRYATWKGECEASEGVLKPRTGAKRFINVAFSPYTVLVRYYKDAADKDVRIDLHPFWPRWDKPVGGVLQDDSLVVTWKVEGDTASKLKLGRIVVWDKNDAPVFAAGLDEAALKRGEYDWKAKGKDIVKPQDMPYRVQIQAHSDTDEPKGLALAVMHTEVRLWVHKDTGTKDDPVKDEKQCLSLALASFQTGTAPPAAGSVRWYKLKLAEAGFHPGPINEIDQTGTAAAALPDYNDAYAKYLKAVDVKAAVDQLVDWATKAKAAVKDAQDDVTAAQASITTAKTDAATAQTRAATAATAAADAVASIAQAFRDAKSAYDGRKSAFVKKATVATRIATAKGTLATAKAQATAARDAANLAKAAVTTTKTSASTAKTDAGKGAVSASAADGKAVNKIDWASAWAAEAKKLAAAAPSPGPLVTKLTEANDLASVSGGNAKATAATSATDSKAMFTAAKKTATDAAQAETRANDSGTRWDGIVTLIDGAVRALDADDLTTAKSGMELANGQSAGAKTAADTAKTAADTLKATADAADGRATTSKASADAAYNAANALKTKADEAQPLAANEETSKKTTLDTKAAALATTAGTSPLYTALAEFQRSYPKNTVAPFERIPADGTKNADTQAALDRLTGDERPMFGNPTSFADYTRAQAAPLFKDKTKDLIVWIDDRHAYTHGATNPADAMAMLDYRGQMDIGDRRTKTDAWSSARPWIPVEVGLPLLKKSDALEQTGDAPAITDEMRRAIGPLRVDFSFEELPPDVSVIPKTTDAEDAAAKAAYQKAKLVLEKAVEAFTASRDALAATTASQKKAATSQTKITDAKNLVATAQPHADAALLNAITLLTRAQTALTRAQEAAADSKKAKKTAAKQAVDEMVAALAPVGPSIATVGNDRTAMAAAVATAVNAATAAKTEASDAKAAGKVADAKTKTDAFKTETDNAPSPAPVIAAALTAKNRGPTAETSANAAKTKTDAVKTALDTTVTNELDPIAGLITAANTQLANADAAAKLAQKRAGKSDAVAKAQDAAAKAQLARDAVDALKTRVYSLRAAIDRNVLDATQAAADALAAKNDAKLLQDDVLAAARLADAEHTRTRDDPKRQDQDNHRSRKYVEEILGEHGKGKKVGAKLYTNCPAQDGAVDRGGIRPDNLDLYYKAPFSIDKDTSLSPWLAVDDQANKLVCTLVHDDLGQETGHLDATRLGKAGIYLRPSRVAGDGYRFRARVGFKPLPGGGDKSPANYAVLEKRYPQLPDTWSPSMRVWRKTSFRGYIGWMPAAVAGWQDAMDATRDFYKHAHVYFVHEGPNRDAHQSFKPVDAVAANGLIAPGDYRGCVNAKLNVVGSDYHGKAVKYTDGYIWPYLDELYFGISRYFEGDLGKCVKWFYGKLEETSWDLFSKELIHLLIKNIEVKKGRFRGHVVAEFLSSPPVVIYEYTCDNAGCLDAICHVVSDRNGGTVAIDGANYAITDVASGADCRLGCGGHYAKSKERVLDHLPLCAIGQPLGGSWLFVPRNAATWAHEIGHHRHFEHAQANSGSDDAAPGAKTAQHDSEASPHQTGAPKPHQKAWDRFCIMSYDEESPQRFCGKCILRNRGWAVEDIANPAGATQDH